MRAFTYILAGLYPDIDAARCAFETPPDRSGPVNHEFVPYALLSSLLLGHGGAHGCTKFSILKRGVLDNVHVRHCQREAVLDKFSEAQRCYSGLCRFARLWKIKRARVGCTETDLYMNPLSDLRDAFVIELFDDSSRTTYKFRLSDLIAISESSLSNSPEFFSDPQEIRNPYTNIPFNTAQLYTIYMKIKTAGYDMPLLFSQYYRAGFDLTKFCESNECYIREVAIENFVRSGSDGEKYYYVAKMLREHRRDLNGVSVHPGFPNASLLQTFKPYLRDYLLETYSLHPARKYRARITLQASLLRFGRLNPTYGRRVIELDDAESAETGRPEFRTTYVDTVLTRTPEVTPRARRGRAGEALDHRPAARFTELEPAPNDEEAERRAEANEYRAARALERDSDAGASPVAQQNPVARTLMQIAEMRESISEASMVINRLAAAQLNGGPAAEDAASEDPWPEDPAPEDPAPEDPAPEDPAPEDPAPEDPAPEDPAQYESVQVGDNVDLNTTPVNSSFGEGHDESRSSGRRAPTRLPPLDMAAILRRYGARERARRVPAHAPEDTSESSDDDESHAEATPSTSLRPERAASESDGSDGQV